MSLFDGVTATASFDETSSSDGTLGVTAALFVLTANFNRRSTDPVTETKAALKSRTALTTVYAAGLRVSELVLLKITDIDSQRMVIRVEQGQGRLCC